MIGKNAQLAECRAIVLNYRERQVPLDVERHMILKKNAERY